MGRGFHCLSKSFDEINFLTKTKKSSDRTNRESKKSHVHDHSVGLCVKIVKKKEKRFFFHSGNDMISSLRPVQGKKIIWKKQFVRETPRLCCLLTFLLDRKRPSVCYIPPRDWSRKEEKKWDPMFAVSISWLTKRLFAARAELRFRFTVWLLKSVQPFTWLSHFWLHFLMPACGTVWFLCILLPLVCLLICLAMIFKEIFSRIFCNQTYECIKSFQNRSLMCQMVSLPTLNLEIVL